MGNNEDYLDSLLNSVTKKLSEFDEDFEQKKDLEDPYMSRKKLPPKTQKALEQVRENQFLKDFEDELKMEDTDGFLADFEHELDGEMFGGQEEHQADTETSDGEYFSQVQQLVEDAGKEPEVQDEDVFATVNQAGEDAKDTPVENFSLDDETEKVAIPKEELAVDEPDLAETLDTPVTEELSEASDLEAEEDQEEAMMQEHDSEEVDPPEGMENLESLFDDEEELLTGDSPDEINGDEETLISEDDADNQDLKDLLSDLPEDEALSDIGKMLEADENSIELEDISAEPENLSQAAAVVNSQASVTVKKEKKEKKPGILAKILGLLFGEDEDDLAASGISETGDLENISDENMKILQEMEGDTLAEPEAGKKGKKAKKEKKPKKEKPKKEKKPKVKKEKKPKPEGPKEKPLPRKPVILIWLMAISLFALIYIGVQTLGYSSLVAGAKQDFSTGNYVKAYGDLAGASLKSSSDKELYGKATTLGSVQEELNAYYSLMKIDKYAMALDCLVRGIGRYDLHSAEAQKYGVSNEMDALEKEIEQQLKDQFSVSVTKARELYKIKDRSEYSLALEKILDGLGLTY